MVRDIDGNTANWVCEKVCDTPAGHSNVLAVLSEIELPTRSMNYVTCSENQVLVVRIVRFKQFLKDKVVHQ